MLFNFGLLFLLLASATSRPSYTKLSAASITDSVLAAEDDSIHNLFLQKYENSKLDESTDKYIKFAQRNSRGICNDKINYVIQCWKFINKNWVDKDSNITINSIAYCVSLRAMLSRSDVETLLGVRQSVMEGDSVDKPTVCLYWKIKKSDWSNVDDKLVKYFKIPDEIDDEGKDKGTSLYTEEDPYDRRYYLISMDQEDYIGSENLDNSTHIKFYER